MNNIITTENSILIEKDLSQGFREYHLVMKMVQSASSILVLLKHNGQEKLVKPAIGDGKILWSGHSGFEWIGKEDEEWDSIFLVEYPSPSELLQSVEMFRENNFEKIRLFTVKTESKMKIRLIRFMMKYIFSLSSIELLGDVPNWDLLPERDILPTKDQQLRVAREKKDVPIVMVNFLGYYDEPRYPTGFKGKRGKDGEEAYGMYGSRVMRVVAKLGGIVENAGEIESLLIGEYDLNVTQFALMRYHTLEALHGMFRVKENIEGGIHRDAGLETTRVYAFTPDNL